MVRDKIAGTESGSRSFSHGFTVPVPAPSVDHKMHSFEKKFGKNLAFLHSKFFYKEKIDKLHQIYCKM